MLRREAEDRPSDTATTYRGHSVDDVVVGIEMPGTIDLSVGLVWPRNKGKDGERPLVVGHKETVPARDVFLSVDASRIPVGPLSHIPIRLHERPGVRVRPLDEREVGRGSDSNLHISIIGASAVRC